MKASTRKSILIGICCGIVFSIIFATVAIINDGNNEIVQSILNFFGSTTAFIAINYNLPEFVGIIIFFIYWALIGGVLGLLLSRKPLAGYILTLIFIILLVAGHRMLQVKLENSLELIGRAFEKILNQAFTK